MRVNNHHTEKNFSSDDSEKIERTIKKTAPPYDKFEKKIRLIDLIDILDDIWGEEDA